ncbi:MAG: (d)CMP kinase [Phycisphaerae bacterium]|jgi:cytidylate kinase
MPCVITIDGPAASGKSTAARLLAQRIGAVHLDTGSMYRAVTLAAMKKKINLADEKQILDVVKNSRFDFKAEADKMRVLVDGADVTDEIRSNAVTANSKYIASAPNVRKELVLMQRDFAAKYEKIVTEGRDQGTVAFADADLKFYLVADVQTRAQRRMQELKGDEKISFDELVRAIEDRDAQDAKRADGPMKPAKDATIIDTTNLAIEQMVDVLVSHVENICF